MYDHSYIEDRIREARRMRDEAIGEMISAIWHGLNDFTTHMRHRVAHAAHAVVNQVRSHHLLHH